MNKQETVYDSVSLKNLLLRKCYVANARLRLSLKRQKNVMTNDDYALALKLLNNALVVCHGSLVPSSIIITPRVKRRLSKIAALKVG